MNDNEYQHGVRSRSRPLSSIAEQIQAQWERRSGFLSPAIPADVDPWIRDLSASQAEWRNKQAAEIEAELASAFQALWALGFRDGVVPSHRK